MQNKSIFRCLNCSIEQNKSNEESFNHIDQICNTSNNEIDNLINPKLSESEGPSSDSEDNDQKKEQSTNKNISLSSPCDIFENQNLNNSNSNTNEISYDNYFDEVHYPQKLLLKDDIPKIEENFLLTSSQSPSMAIEEKSNFLKSYEDFCGL